MDVSEVVDQGTLKAYLDALPQGERASVNSKAEFKNALRALPVLLSELCKFSGKSSGFISVLDAFVCTAVFGVFASSGSFDAMDHAFDDYQSDFGDDAYFQRENEYKTHRAHGNDTYRDAAAAITAPIIGGGWGGPFSIRSPEDIEHLQRDLLGKTEKIWEGGIPTDIQTRWEEAKSALTAEPENKWSFWIAWYERVRDGKNWHPDRVLKVLETLKEDGPGWRGNPATINPYFDEVFERYALERAKAGEVIQVNAAGQFFAVALTELSSDIHSEVIDRVGDAVADLRTEIDSTQSHLACLIDVLALIEHWLDWYDDRPIRLYEKLADAMDRVAVIAKNNGLERDSAILVLLRELERSRTDLRANDPKIEERVRRRVRVRYDELDEQNKELFHDLIEAGADGSVPALKREMNEDLPVMKSDNVPNDEKERALVREAERTVQMTSFSREGVVAGMKDFNAAVKAGENSGTILQFLWNFFL